ncbi:MAG: sulfurtransferase TusA family protein [Proteobacteria bacterium]|nr:sulfurtransferase TusA family protein [Desulfobulbaceae bacterium]MBU4151863.1 sulfurtransferase TusA family protein [Pseudomonadota bacterium]MDP2106107.1 sulfurtransferase TusA family protein [Desulfobulbaceae bacterium]
MSDSIYKEIVIDIRGQVCPSTLLATMAEMNEHQKELLNGEISLLIISDNRHAIATIPETARNMGYRVEVKQELGFYSIRIGHENGN